MVNPLPEPAPTDIAVIGMAGRFPGARNLDEFWENLRGGVESIRSFTEEELRASDISPELIAHPDYVNANGALDDIDLFDAEFFGFNPREAEVIDPQNRLFLECAWQALESAGYIDRLEGPAGVFAGTSMNSYLVNNLLRNPHALQAVGFYQAMIGNDKDFVPLRVSYRLNLKGPGLAIQTACSTSLVAIQVACQSLLTYQTDLALAGGVSAPPVQKTGYLFQEGMIMSPDGHCRAFDARANGTVGGSGVGVVVLKRLSDALRDCDTIDAIVKGAAINNDGSGKIGFTAPSVEGQAEVIAMAQAMAEVSPETISYIEAHGTGTKLGDPIEIAALTQVFRASTSERQYCGIGSVKTNIGHLDAAAGVAGFMKTVLALKHGVIPPSLHYSSPNPQIDFSASPFYVNAAAREWASNGTPRRAGVSSFGIGGTNAHVVLQEAPAATPTESHRPSQTLVLSATSPEALDQSAERLADHLQTHPELDLADVAYTLQLGRRAFSHRRSIVCEDREEAVTQLRAARGGSALSNDGHRPVAFMFSGQGSQHINMAWELYQNEPRFHEEVDRCAELFRPLLSADLRSVIYPGLDGETADPSTNGESQQRLNQTAWTQPALFTIEYSLAQLWISRGVVPDVMIGHSLGEYTAACLASVMTLEEAVAIVAVRSRLMQDLPHGRMLAVSLSEASLLGMLSEDLSLAAVNGPSMCTVAGPAGQVEQLESRLKSDRIPYHRLRTSHAFHSQMVEPMLAPFESRLRSISLEAPQIPFVSNVTGSLITREETCDPTYWCRHVRSGVRFADGLQQIMRDPECILLEVGPANTLCSLARQNVAAGATPSIFASLPHPKDGSSSSKVLERTTSQLWQCGVQIRWDEVHKHETLHRVPLPTYPFQRKRYWIEPLSFAEESPNSGPRPEARKTDLADWFYAPGWKRAAALPETRPDKTNWLVFLDRHGIGWQIADRLEGDGHGVIRVSFGEQRQENGREFVVNPSFESDYAWLVDRLREEGPLPAQVLHCGGVFLASDELEGDTSAESFEDAQELGFYSLLHLAKAFMGAHVGGPTEINVVANNLHHVLGDERLCPEAATVLGIAKVIPQEAPGIRCRVVEFDIGSRPTGGPDNHVLSQIYAECLAPWSASSVALRGRHRWVPQFDAHPLPEPGHSRWLRAEGVYVITGGLGRIGLAFACSLARHQEAKLALLGRTGLPPRTEWGEWLATHEASDTTSRRIHHVRELERLGAEVMICEVDVADSEQLSQVLDQIDARYGTIHGVIHAAGLVVGETIDASTRAHCEQQFRAKAQGLIALKSALRGRDLEFCLVTSSLSAVLGGFGFAAYASANVFMDVFAQMASRDCNYPWLAVDWDGWRPEMKESGHESQAPVLENLMTDGEGVQIFERLAASQVPSPIVVSTSDLTHRITQWVEPRGSVPAEAEPASGGTTLHERPNLATTYAAASNESEQTLIEIWQMLLGVKNIGVQDDFFALGGHSLLGTQVITRIQDAFGVSLPLRAIFEAPTIAALSERIETTLWAVHSQKNAPELTEELEELEF